VRLDPLALDVLAVAGVTIAVVALLVAALAHLRLRRLRRDLVLLQGDDDSATFVEAVARSSEEVRGLRGDLARQGRALAEMRTDLADAIRHVAVVRYDAFADLGGRYSFSLALLDDDADGLVLTAIHGRSDTRTYFKGVRGGVSDDPLSPEEQRAITLARGAERA
jgi:hypothetical protein